MENYYWIYVKLVETGEIIKVRQKEPQSAVFVTEDGDVYTNVHFDFNVPQPSQQTLQRRMIAKKVAGEHEYWRMLRGDIFQMLLHDANLTQMEVTRETLVEWTDKCIQSLYDTDERFFEKISEKHLDIPK